MNLEQFYQLSDDEVGGTKGGFGLTEAVGIAGVLNAAVQIFNAGYKFGSDLAQIWLRFGSSWALDNE